MRRRRLARGRGIAAAVLALALLFPAVARANGVEAPAVADSVRARSLFEALEKRLLEAETVQFTSKISSHGAVESRFEGTVAIASGNRASVEQEGELRGTPITVKFSSNGKALRVDAGEKSLTVGSVGKLGEALLVGFTRLGFLHQLYVLSQGRVPDWTDGTARAHIALDGWRRHDNRRLVIDGGWGEAPPGPQETEKAIALSFRILFDGAPAGKAILWLGGETGLPLSRHQEVYFGPDTMRVSEEYSDFRLDEPVAPERFLVPNPR